MGKNVTINFSPIPIWQDIRSRKLFLIIGMSVGSKKVSFVQRVYEIKMKLFNFSVRNVSNSTSLSFVMTFYKVALNHICFAACIQDHVINDGVHHTYFLSVRLRPSQKRVLFIISRFFFFFVLFPNTALIRKQSWFCQYFKCSSNLRQNCFNHFNLTVQKPKKCRKKK